MPRLISLFDVGPIADHLAAGHLLLTPNQRLASRIRSAYAIYCREKGQRVIQTPAVYSLNSWIESNWQYLLLKASSCVMDCKRLNVVQEQVIWEHIVEQSMLGTALLRPSATAQQAISAYKTMVEWRQDFSAPGLRAQFQSDDDCAVFLSWVDEFERRCVQHQWLPQARQPERLITAYQQRELKKVDKVLGVGFDDITPLHQALIDSAGAFSVTELGEQAPNATAVGCGSVQDELLAAAVWAKQVLRDNPKATVALVVPDLAQQRQAVQRVLQEVFEPHFSEPGQLRNNLPFNFSAGYPLLEAPVISAALDGLSLCQGSLALNKAAALCQSPFYCLHIDDSELIGRLVSLLYNERDYSISSPRFRQLAQKVSERVGSETAMQASEEISWHFATALQDQANCARGHSIAKPRKPSYWLPVIRQLLETIGWPGTRRLDSIEYQQVSQWLQVLEQFASLDVAVQSIGFAKALTYLRGMLSRHIFQPQTADSSLQVLGTLEAAGLTFSHMWLLSMSAQQWPPQPSANALLPFSLQREQQMPHANAERELHYAQRLSQRFIHSTQHLVVSYAEVIDENPARISALFEQLTSSTVPQLLGRELPTLIPMLEIRRRHMESALLQGYQQGDVPRLSSHEAISGGSQLFANQSACPFRAFASHRLGLRALPLPVLGLDSADRGSLLHRALELIWGKLKSQQTLNEQTPSELQKLCADVADYVLNELSQLRALRLGPRYKQLESTRLQQLLQVWLDVEKQREPFVVESLELSKTFRFAELQLQTRIDRIDRLQDGSLVIIDYKTGSSSVNRWWGDRPDEPQLPLYSLLTDNALNDTPYDSTDNDDCVGAIAFAQVRIDGCALKGIGSEQLPEPQLQWQDKIQSDAGVQSWQQLKQRWQKVLNALARDFIAGNSVVDPKQPPQTCQYCDLSSVCRINHRSVEQ